MNYYTKQTKLGLITIVENSDFIIQLYFGKKNCYFENKLTPLLEEAFIQLNEYFLRTRKEFSVPLNPTGTKFQQKVWSKIYQIPYSQVRTYKEIAIQINNPNAYRAVGNANNRNPIPIFIPCHRVIGSNRSLVGYVGGLDIKRQLLNIEKTIL